MKVVLLTVGKTDVAWVREGLELYLARLRHYIPFSLNEIKELKGVSALSPAEIKKREGKLLLAAVKPQDRLMLLDEHGKLYRSLDFAAALEQWMRRGGSGDLIFAVGGAYGFSEEVYSRADGMISLSPMTYSHQMVRTIFAEQLYRAFTIIKGDPYHNE